jgi:divalent metal cation (Fe/Co/Zn/Cd) transporter
MRVANKYSSQALEADALHFSTDVWSSSVVILGLFLVSLANILNLPWLVKADAIAAILVAGIVIYVSIQLGRKTIFDLLDAIPPGLRDEVSHATGQVPGVQAVERVRIRRSGPDFFTDVEVLVQPDLALESAHEIASQVEAAIRAYLPEADVVVHVAPEEPQDAGMIKVIYRIAARQGLRVHSVRLYEIKAAYSLELHLEVDEALSLDDAHAQATALEESLRLEMPGLKEIVTHIEPIGEFSSTRQQVPSEDDKILAVIQEALDQLGLCFDPHDVKIRRSAEALSISFHCIMDGETAITEAHALTEQVEGALYASIPNLGRVVIHVEPPQFKDLEEPAQT